MQKKIFLLEDDYLLSESIKEFLEHLGYEVTCAFNGEEAYNLLTKERFNLLLLDVQVPKMNSLELFKNIKNDFLISTPTIFITALQDNATLKHAFNLGASDYLKKPFDLDELEARIKRFFNDEPIEIMPNISYYNGVLNIHNQQEILQPKVAKLLEYFLAHKNQIISSQVLENNLWEQAIEDSTLRTYIKVLRKLLGKDCIETHKGVGYCFKPL
ncbi:copper response regulator transcription factor CrdR [Helicobacter cetorum]|uniref:copper response regulator transcription factor CrdR n=1 Tax=Helicobacter cetorum TaxID=138563 RepID=UPI000CF170EF|nr:copper response regulator transcription factor CrdR [Helicobacter cetorum]